MRKEEIYAKNDLVFKMIFGNPNNHEVLIGFLQSVLDIPKEEYDTIELVDPNFRIDELGGKLGILDVKLHTKSGSIINIEIQVKKASDLKQRILFYVSRMITEQLPEGERYDKIKRVISIMICTDHNLIEDSVKYHNRYLLRDNESGSLFTDLLEINILEFKKVPLKDESILASWLKFLNTTNKEELDMISTKNSALKKAVCEYKKITSDERKRMLIQAREDAWRDEEARKKAAYEDGIKEGEKKGKQEGLKEGVEKGLKEGEKNSKIQIAKKMMSKNINISEIIEFTGLSENDLENLK